VIPRTKVNYRLPALLSASFIREGDHVLRQNLASCLAEKFCTPHILLTASGRGALYVLLSCLPQRKLLIPAYTCKAVVEAAQLSGKELVFGESEDDGFNMSANAIKGKLDENTILLATHQFGIPCEIREMVSMASKAGAFVIEDVAAALGGTSNGKLMGTFGDAAFFSFDSTKLVNAPLKAGFLLVRDAPLYARCKSFMASYTSAMPAFRKFRYLLLGAILVSLEQPSLYRLFHNLKFHWRGRFTDDSDDLSPRLGPFYLDRLAEWQAALLLPQIKRLDTIISTRRRIYSRYRRRLSGAVSFALPPTDTLGEWSPIRFPIRVYRDKLNFYNKAAKRGVDFAFSFSFIASPQHYSLSHALASTVLDLPFYGRLSDQELERVCRVLLELDAFHYQQTVS